MRKKLLIIFSIFFILLSCLLLYAFLNNINKPINEDNHYKEEEKDPLIDYKNTSNFKIENTNRYLRFKEKNKDYDYEKVVTFVNIGLDYEFYSFIKEADLSKGNLVLVNKYLKLDKNYVPDDLETISSKYSNGTKKLKKEAKEAFEKLSKDALSEGYSILAQSTYRSFNTQKSLYDKAVANGGISYADSDTARSGHSEHQTGLAVDVATNKVGMMNFHTTPSYTWMINNAHKYGFILRYPKGYEDIHGYVFESWHYRYVGVDVAVDMHDNYPNLTFDEYYYKVIEKGS